MTGRLPFKKQTKYVVERKIDGEQSLFWKRNGKVRFEPSGNDVDNRVASVICEKDFLLEGYTVDGCFYASDVVFFDGEDLTGSGWPERYKILKNEFRWNSAVRMNRPLVVTGREEMRHALELFNMLDYSEGVIVRDYDSDYGDDKMFLSSEVVS